MASEETKTLTLEISAKLHEKFHALAKEMGKTPSEYAAYLIGVGKVVSDVQGEFKEKNPGVGYITRVNVSERPYDNLQKAAVLVY